MNRLVLIVLGILVVGAGIHPLLTGANQTDQRPMEATTSNAALHPSPAATDSSSALTVVRGKEGFWRLAKDATGAWWFISPQGKREFLNTVTTVQPYQGALNVDGPHYVSRDWNGTVGGQGNIDHWAKTTLQRVRDAGFKGLGAWSNPAFHQLDVPMTRDLNISAWIHTTGRLYDPQWATEAEKAIKEQVIGLRDNKNLVGYYTDNELDWGDSGVGPWIYFNGLPPDNPNRQQVMSVIRKTWGTPEQFNKDWDTSIGSWGDLDAWTALPQHPEAYGRLFSAWLGHYAQDYFRLTSTLIRQFDPNHLILGVRFKSLGPPEVAEASRQWTDAQSLNYYVNDALVDSELFQMLYEKSGQPIIISEYAFHALDGRSGNRNTVGFAAQVLDQQARADGYRLFTTRLARIPYVVGADWFQWFDEPPSGRSADGEDVNFGVVDIDDRPYQQLTEAVRATTPQLNPLHAASATDPKADVWRESYAVKPVMPVPYLNMPITLNGELSDWPAQSRIPSIRHSQTIGLERSSIPVPNVFLGWTSQGLYLGMEIFDNDISGAPADGWWWTKDNVEFWIATRPVKADQITYTPYCHQFFFVPNDFVRGSMGTVGQWHRPGDALSGNLIPHPTIKQAVRIMPDRYVVELFIPAEALKGFDPQNQPHLAFNIHIRNFQHATDYFWSAPKEVYTHLRPNTWGTLELQPAQLDDVASIH